MTPPEATSVHRRRFLVQSIAVTAGFAGLRSLCAGGGLRTWTVPVELVEDPRGIVDLPSGFSYHVFSKAGEEMDDGLFVPGLHDGMGAFPGPGGSTVLVRNHEISPLDTRIGPWGWTNERLGRIDPEQIYDRGRDCPILGGCTTLVYDTARRELLQHSLSLTGTVHNCAGGTTPWGTWLSCEESQVQVDDDHRVDHGYAFEVPATTTMGLAPPIPLRAMGRFQREAVAVDTTSGFIYQTEDIGDGLLYRFLPSTRGVLADGGRLQALAVIDRPSCDLRNWPAEEGEAMTPRIPVGTPMAVRWVDLEDVESPNNDLRHRGFADGAARFARAEGIWPGHDGIYFACTTGGEAKVGQIWRLRPSEGDSGTLELFLEPNDAELIKNCDNVTMAPWGDLVVAEDGEGKDRLLIVKPDGRVFPLAMNAMTKSEFCGVTFSPDGSTLFVNVQSPGISMAITGNWEAIRRT